MKLSKFLVVFMLIHCYIIVRFLLMFLSLKWGFCCDLLEKSYLCGINNNYTLNIAQELSVVICLKNRTFVVLTTTFQSCITSFDAL